MAGNTPLDPMGMSKLIAYAWKARNCGVSEGEEARRLLDENACLSYGK
jgi:hypothetical protein